jgi:GNAT superfamily N-acetyltransferase
MGIGGKMEFRKAERAQIESIMGIIRKARAYFKEQGINQWQEDYPNEDTIRQDIALEQSYVLLTDNEIVATASVSFDGEKTYGTIYEGAWISNQEYAVIHRMAVSDARKGQGLASEIIGQVACLCLEKGVYSIRVDTHEDNRPMRRTLEKNKFTFCGIICLADGNRRMAYEKMLNP